MKVTVDPDRCQGHARCWDICPEVYALDDQGHGQVLVADIPAEFETKAREAAANCPERAIIVN
ncbi:ferredoxin [Streptomyces sp. NPDC002577]